MKRACSYMLSTRVLACLFGLPLLAQASKPEHAIWQTYNDLAAGKCRSTSLSDDGVLAPAPVLTNLGDLSAAEVWAVAARPDKTLVVGTAPEGKLYLVPVGGKSKQLAKFEESHIYAVALGPRGEIYAATSPDGKVYRVSADGKVQVWFNPGEKYIWCLAVAPDGTLYVGTGTRGRIYKVDGKGHGEIFYASNEVHIRSLAVEKDGTVLAGSAESGYLYRVSGPDQAVVLAATGREEVNQICVRPDGVIWFTATGASKEGGSDANLKKAADAPSGAGGDKDANSSLYQLSGSLFPQLLWSTKDTILSCVWDEAQNGALIGTSPDGYIYLVGPRGEATRLGKVESDSVTAITQSGKDSILAASNPGRLFLLGSDQAQPGIYETNVLDAGGFARWGAVNLDASDPTSVKIETRSGNTARPDKTWYPWSEAKDGQPQSPSARYLQVQLQIGAGTVDKIDACYLPENQPPHIESVKLLPVGTGYVQAQVSPLSPLPQTSGQILEGSDAPPDQNAMHYQAQNGHGMRTLLWKATDPNGDDLTYDVFWRKKGESGWHDLSRHLTDSLLTWDTSGWNEGRYELKIVASDAEANPPGEGLTDTAFSRELVVNNTAPAIQIAARKGGKVEFTVKDALSTLQSVTVSTDGQSYHPLTPVDGILDSSSERFEAPVGDDQTLFIRAEDDSGNVAGAQAGK